MRLDEPLQSGDVTVAAIVEQTLECGLLHPCLMQGAKRPLAVLVQDDQVSFAGTRRDGLLQESIAIGRTLAAHSDGDTKHRGSGPIRQFPQQKCSGTKRAGEAGRHAPSPAGAAA